MINIRLANVSDLDQIIKTEQICFPKEEAASAEEIRQRFQTFHENFLVAVDQEKVIGFINGSTTHFPTLPDELYHHTNLHDATGDYQTVFGLDVLPDYRHQGIAGKLLDEFVNLAIKRGKKGMVLTCKDYLIPFYEKHGFVCQGISSSHHGGASWNDMIYCFGTPQ